MSADKRLGETQIHGVVSPETPGKAGGELSAPFAPSEVCCSATAQPEAALCRPEGRRGFTSAAAGMSVEHRSRLSPKSRKR